MREMNSTTDAIPTWRERALAFLREPGSTLFGLMDAAQDPEILALIQEGGCPFESLYQGESAVVMASVAPYLVQLDPEKGLLQQLVLKGWGKNWGIYLRSCLPLAKVRRHFRHFTMVELPDGQQVYFRFYDPRVFRVFMPTCNASENSTIFEGIESIFAEGTDGNTMNIYRLEGSDALRTEAVF
jgi:Domain of unknown function (DUF4123)